MLILVKNYVETNKLGTMNYLDIVYVLLSIL